MKRMRERSDGPEIAPDSLLTKTNFQNVPREGHAPDFLGCFSVSLTILFLLLTPLFNIYPAVLRFN